jgi:hypothetical protein
MEKQCDYRQKNFCFISTDADRINMHQDSRGGNLTKYKAAKMQRTLLSNATAEYLRLYGQA